MTFIDRLWFSMGDKSPVRKEKFRLKAETPPSRIPTAPPPALPRMLEAAAPESKGGRSLDFKM